MTKAFSTKLLHWFDQFGRHDLPWQKQKTAYRVWLSEIMLQQTQVKTVIDYFHRFITRFPNIKTLATADIDAVLQLWAGLGYYARARNLHRAAQIIYQDYNGRFPRTVEELQQLPGIGRSTAGAIIAIAFGNKAVILDGNVKRVLSRVHAVSGSPTDKTVMDTLWAIAEKLTPSERVGDYTQAIMDLGATLCTRQQPRCGECPLQSLCKAHRLNRVLDFPAKKAKKEKPKRDVHLILLENNLQQIFLHKRPDSGIWGGLWCLPEVMEKEAVLPWCTQHHIKKYTVQPSLAPIKHVLTHFALQIHIHPVKCVVGKPHPDRATLGTWTALSTLTSLGFPAPIQKLFKRYYHD
ncbi:MAG: / specific adenine glycosylase [Gammaproteobacteria bacterium]|jgi:A/G-specific adenine glycosylase|nr:/ specific adenine glycosylase [Gammaproteobacteria bacterium]